MRALATIQDPTYTEKDHYSALDKLFLKIIRDKRNLPFMYLMMQITFILLPLGILLYFPINPIVWWVGAVAYIYLNNFYFKGPFGLMLHNVCHSPFYKKKYQWLDKYLPWVVGPFFGQTPETYYSHHIIMHHVENNMEDDKSTTLHYKRDSFQSFLSYFFNFLLIGLYELYHYFKAKKRKKFIRKILMGETIFIAMCVALSFISFPATLVVFILPFFISRFIMMLGNFTQHAFIDPDDPDNFFTNCITTINVKYNHKCWNDGYHIGHHIRPSMHWTEMPKDFMKNKDKYAENKSLVFEGVDYLKIFVMLMNKKYDKLADHIVNVNGMFKSKEEVIKLMKYRTQRIVSV